MKRITLVFFLAVALAELLAVILSWAPLNFIVKPLIVISLAAYYLTNTTHRRSLFLIAMAFCWLGDVLLMFQDDQPIFFMAGLGAFLLGHVLYIMSYQRLRLGTGSSALLGPQKIRFSLPIILAGTGLVVVLYPKLDDLTVPVMVYALVITVMALQALFRFGYTNKKSFTLIFIGALFFMISDSLLAINKFLTPVPLASLGIMFTYMLAQYLIVEGVLAHDNK
jgi:uncharacterized membrane protein YhhN